MSTPGRPDGGVNPFSETMHRGIDSNEVSLDKNSTAQVTNPSYAATGHYPTGGIPQPDQYTQPSQEQYAYQQYPMSGGFAPYPPQQRQSSAMRGVLIGLTIACIVALGVGCVVVWKKVSEKTSDTTSQTTAAQQATGPTTTLSTAHVDPETKAQTDLASAAAADTSYMRSNYNNRWTAQISAKQPGLYAEGRTWDNAAIYNEYVSMKQRYPNVRLLRSSEWPVFSITNWWIIVSAQSFPTPSSALNWCVSQSLDKDHCFAKFISSSSGPEGSTLYQR
ncbi:hypothetical protein nbrc107696_17340 [Gordonia spumicola]|uniref:Uncharacterized protein n=1 Tax=Gordonia spumicola TaxID=589161 RepID=A0A7I9V7C7_9ACTN|nr:hypothetical protein [Gordonia spumicola]GEE01288.1 hypothetical protein nbrc107696_17340 [Gordonia spumicola]